MRLFNILRYLFCILLVNLVYKVTILSGIKLNEIGICILLKCTFIIIAYETVIKIVHLNILFALYIVVMMVNILFCSQFVSTNFLEPYENIIIYK